MIPSPGSPVAAEGDLRNERWPSGLRHVMTCVTSPDTVFGCEFFISNSRRASQTHVDVEQWLSLGSRTATPIRFTEFVKVHLLTVGLAMVRASANEQRKTHLGTM